ncbi:hypothetical protein ACP70R_044390 [Stipagrostis hirtigluma subsp. patula]
MPATNLAVFASDGSAQIVEADSWDGAWLYARVCGI